MKFKRRYLLAICLLSLSLISNVYAEEDELDEKVTEGSVTEQCSVESELEIDETATEVETVEELSTEVSTEGVAQDTEVATTVEEQITEVEAQTETLYKPVGTSEENEGKVVSETEIQEKGYNDTATKEDIISETGNLSEEPPVYTTVVAKDSLVTVAGFHVDPSKYPEANIDENTKVIYKFLREELKLNHASACGVLSNMQLESNFNPLALGDSGSSYGICQWHLGRFSSLMSFCNNNNFDYNTLEGQLAYLKQELTGDYVKVYNYLLGVENTPEGAYKAAYYMCVYFESPDQASARGAQRGNLAQNEFYGKDFEERAKEVAELAKSLVTVLGGEAEAISNVNVREEANSSSNVLLTLQEGDSINVLDTSGGDGWYRVRYQRDSGESIEGYVKGTYLNLTELTKTVTMEYVGEVSVVEDISEVFTTSWYSKDYSLNSDTNKEVDLNKEVSAWKTVKLRSDGLLVIKEVYLE